MLLHAKKAILSYRELKVIPEDLINLEFADNLNELCLNNNKLFLLPTTMLSKLVNVQSLSLECNGLILIPQEIGLLSQLRYLNVSFNPITCLPSSIVKLVNLEELWLRSCSMAEFPPPLADLVNIKRLSLADNHITNIPNELVSLTQLNWLSLDNNNISLIPVYMKDLRKLEVIHLQNNLISEFPPIMVIMEGLIMLNLQKNKIVSIANDLALWLISVCKFGKLDLRGNKIEATANIEERPWHRLDFVLLTHFEITLDDSLSFQCVL